MELCFKDNIGLWPYSYPKKEVLSSFLNHNLYHNSATKYRHKIQSPYWPTLGVVMSFHKLYLLPKYLPSKNFLNAVFVFFVVIVVLTQKDNKVAA